MMLYSSVNFNKTDQIDISDRGLAFGDGIFTTAKIVDGEIQYRQQHLQRLQAGCSRLAIVDVDWLNLNLELSKAAKQQPLATLKVIISAGNSQRGYSRAGIASPTIIVTVSEFPCHYHLWQQQGVVLGLSSIKLGINPQLAGLKHLNRLEQVLIRNELDTLNVDEVIVTDLNDNIVECNTANIFWLNNNIWYTPELDTAGVKGIIRNKILSTLTNVQTIKADVGQLKNAQAMFICNSLLGLAAVKQFNDLPMNIAPVHALQQQLKIGLD